jgi:hypothetical protein
MVLSTPWVDCTWNMEHCLVEKVLVDAVPVVDEQADAE